MSHPDPVEALRERANARIGRVLREKWRVDKLLGLGGMAAVYAATHVNNGRRVAIKVMHPELSTNVEVRTRFLREGYAANKLEHPGSVAVLDDDVAEDGSAFIVMELLEGETLEDRRERTGTLPVHEVLSLADRLLDVLAAAHDRGIVHRDIKPENVFLTKEGTVKVLDFGIARMREVQGARLTMTSAGAIGTPAFMPPEQARGRWDDVGPQSDIWAVGATMYTLLAGRLVHNADTVNELMLAAMTKQAPSLASAVPGIPQAVVGLVDRALAYEIKARWSDARTMQAALRAAYQWIDRGSALPPAPGGFNIADPASVSGVWGPGTSGAFAPVSVPLPASTGAFAAASAQLPPRQMMASSAGIQPPSFQANTGNPVTMVGAGAAPSKKGSGPMLPIVGAAAGALVVGVLLFAFVLRTPKPGGEAGPGSSASASAAMSASAMPSAEPSAVPSAEPSAVPSAEPSAVPSAEPSAVPSAVPSAKPVINRPGKFLRNPKTKHR